MNQIRNSIASILWIFCSMAAANETENNPVILEYPVIDYPFNWSDGYTVPSMQQSLQVTKGLYQYGHYEIGQWLPDRPVARTFAIVGFDIVTIWLPFGTGWLHEEWHRAVMSNYQISSYNEIYDFPLFEDTIAVKKVKDEDLIRLKNESSADMVRLHAAGIEAIYELNLAIEKDRFFIDPPTWDYSLLWLNVANNLAYMHTCASNESNLLTEEILQQEDENISERDFTGLDCNAWAYDLFRANEPYESRGIHPSGVGIQRYIKYDDLSPEEQDYLDRAFTLSFLNLADPFLYSFARFHATNPFSQNQFEWNIKLGMLLTSFGYTVDVNFFYKQNNLNASLVLHNYMNHSNYFPGLELLIFRHPVTVSGKNFPITLRTALWLQPDEQRFFTGKGKPGGIATIKWHIPTTKNFETFVEVEGKSEGWVAGNVYLEENISLRLGLSYFIQ